MTSDLTALLSSLVAVDSVNPTLVAGGAGETEIAGFTDPYTPRIDGDRLYGRGGYWADAAFIAAAGIPTVLFGPRGEGAHAVEEWVSLSATEAVARTLVGLARRFCA